MELIKCKDCNKEISKSAPTCPNCGAKQKKPASMGCVVLIIITVLAIGYVASMDVSSGGGEKNPINAEITKNLTTLYIANADTYTWPSAKIYVNGIMGGYEYEYNESIPSGTRLELGLLDFTKRNGDRFQPHKTDVKEVIVSVPGYDSPIYTY